MTNDLFNLADYLVDRHVRERRGEKTAIRFEDRSFTYAQVGEQVNRAGKGLLRMGVRPSERVLLLLPDCLDFAAAYLSVIKIGAIAVPTNTALRSPDYAYLLDESEAAAVIVHSTVLAQVEPVLGERKSLRHVITCGERRGDFVFWDDLLAESLPDVAPDLAPEKTKKDDIAFWLWTSGSTGPPKAAVHRQRDWLCCCENYARGVLGIGPDDVTFSSSKLFHAYGLGNGLVFPFYVGATSVLYPGRPQASAILDSAHTARPTLFFSVPTLYAAMLQETDRPHSYDLSSIRLAASAAEPLPPEIFRRWKARFGVEILDGIGSTEALHIYLSARSGKVQPGSTGQPVKGYEIRIVDLEGHEVQPGTIGDLIVRGDSTAPYYWNRRDLSAERMREGWFYSGDKYSVDQAGYFWYAGRADDMLRVSGQWVSPVEVESALARHASVLEAAVVPYQESDGLYTVKAFVVLKFGLAGTPELVQELQRFVKQRITPYKYPRRIEFLPDLPKSATGKLLRFKLRELSGTNRD